MGNGPSSIFNDFILSGIELHFRFLEGELSKAVSDSSEYTILSGVYFIDSSKMLLVNKNVYTMI